VHVLVFYPLLFTMLQSCLTSVRSHQFTRHLFTEAYIQLTKFLRNLQWSCVQLIWSPMTVSHNFPFFLWNIFVAFPAKNSIRASAGGLANLWHSCPKLHLERYPWHAAFTAVPRCFIYFARPEFCILCTMCVCVYTCDCVQSVYELPLLPNSTAMKHFYTNRSGTKFCWIFIVGALVWRWLRQYVDIHWYIC